MTRDTHRSRARYARVLRKAAAVVRAVDTGQPIIEGPIPAVLHALIQDMPHERAIMLRGELVSYRAFSHWKREHPRAIRAAIIQAWPHAYGRTLRDEMYRLEMERHWAQAETPLEAASLIFAAAVAALPPFEMYWDDGESCVVLHRGEPSWTVRKGPSRLHSVLAALEAAR